MRVTLAPSRAASASAHVLPRSGTALGLATGDAVIGGSVARQLTTVRHDSVAGSAATQKRTLHYIWQELYSVLLLAYCCS